uniref:Uncharacterized protein n=1 Tax=Meloidogyne floridensis TaxID=298350 RepID=A0A915P9X4_9BILA
MVENLSIADSNFMQNMLELGNNVLKVQENYNLIIEQNKSLEEEMKKYMMDNDKKLVNIQNSFDQKIKLQKEVINNQTEKFQNLEQTYKENCSSLELKIQKIEEENKDKITNLEQIIQQKDEKIFEEEIKRVCKYSR